MGSQVVKLQVQINENAIIKKLESVISDKSAMTHIHKTFASMCDPYVPMESGMLAEPLSITDQYVQYRGPYAHYQYTGEVYGPNIPIIEDGIVTGWFSPPGKKKHPTGRQITYSTENHPLASKQWDKVMMRDMGNEFTEQVKQIIVRRFNELYG